MALVGPSGSGKSSCINLLEHFYETKAGTVLLDDVPINEYDHKYLHNKVCNTITLTNTITNIFATRYVSVTNMTTNTTCIMRYVPINEYDHKYLHNRYILTNKHNHKYLHKGLGSLAGFRNWEPKIGDCKILGHPIFKGRPQNTQITTITMYFHKDINIRSLPMKMLSIYGTDL